MELLSRFIPSVEIVPSGIAEEAMGSPAAQVRVLAERKARDVARHRAGLIVAADTIVVADGRILGKPSSRADAREMLRGMSGRDHLVLTGLCVLDTSTGRCEQAVESTRVWFRSVSDEEIDAYLSLDEYRDKAGGYAIQGAAALFVERIEGDYYNVIGLPLCRLGQLLELFGCSLLERIRPS